MLVYFKVENQAFAKHKNNVLSIQKEANSLNATRNKEFFDQWKYNHAIVKLESNVTYRKLTAKVELHCKIYNTTVNTGKVVSFCHQSSPVN